jgi:hypothetical protein
MIPVGTTVRVKDPGYGRITGQMGTVVSHHEEFGLLWNDVSIQLSLWYLGDRQLEILGPDHPHYIGMVTDDDGVHELYQTPDGPRWVLLGEVK